MHIVGLALAAVLLASDVPPPQPEPEPERTYWLPVAEVLGTELALQAYDRWGLQRDYGQVTWGTIRHNLQRGFSIDGDPLFGNYLGHPYLGAFTFQAPRSAGFDFWGSSAFALGGSLLWEYAGETTHPSTNDLLNTTVAGSLWGEALHRSAGLLLDEVDDPAWPRWVGATVLDPLGSLNRAILGPRRTERGARFDGRLYAGGLAYSDRGLGHPQALLGADLDYGFPGPDASGWLRPLQHFDARLSAAFGGVQNTDASLRGVLAGYSEGGGRWSGGPVLLGLHDFLSGPGFRVADVALGAGGLVGGRALGASRLRATAAVAAILVGGAGSVAQTDALDPLAATDAPPRYSTGPGAQGLLDAELLGEAGYLRLTAQAWWIATAAPAPQLERVHAVRLGGGLRLFGRGLLGAEAALQQRQPAHPGEESQTGWQLRLTAGLALGDGL